METPERTAGYQHASAPPAGEELQALEPAHPLGDRLGIAACVAVACLVLALGWFKLSSVDLGYHLAYGRHFLATGSIVGRDPFLYPEVARPFVNANWGSQVIMAVTERIGGAMGLIALRLGLLATIFGFLAGMIRRSGLAWSWVAWVWLLAALAAYERFSLRPELFSYAIMTAVMYMLLARPRALVSASASQDEISGRGVHGQPLLRRGWVGICILALLQLAWVNLHSYFMVGLLLTGCHLAGSGMRWTWRRLRGSIMPDLASQVRWLAAAIVIQTLVCLINPWHVRGAVFPLQTLRYLQEQSVMGGAPGGEGNSWSMISEFDSPFAYWDEPINGRTIRAYQVLLAVTGIGVVIALASGGFESLFALLLFFAMLTQMRRNIAQFALTAAPIAAMLMGAVLHGPSSRPRLRSTWSSAARASACSLAIGLAAWFTWQVVAGRFYYAERRVNREFGSGYAERSFPRRAAEWLAAQSALRPNLFVDYFYSSNVLPWLPERFKLFVDTNTFAYDAATLAEAEAVARGRAAYQPFFDRYGVNVVLLGAGPGAEVLIGSLAADLGWALVYFDHHAVIFVRRMAEHVSVIAANRHAPADLEPQAWISQIAETRRFASDRAVELGTTGAVPMSLGWYEQASALLREAVRLAPDYNESWTNLGFCHGMGANAAIRARDRAAIVAHLQSAITCFETALRYRPGDQRTIANLQKARESLVAGQRQTGAEWEN